MTRPRSQQKARTRAALVEAAIERLRAGRAPTVSEVAVAAKVSTATAYRYFPSAASLWQAVLAATGEPDPAQVFAGLERASLAERVDAMVVATARRMLDDEPLWRTVHRTMSTGRGGAAQRVGGGSGQRARWVREALRPAERTLDTRTYRTLAAALMLTFGSSAMLTLRDLGGLDAAATLESMRFAARAVVDAALAQARPSRAIGEPPALRRRLRAGDP